MSELGELLRKARIERKISLEELQETTKIRKRYLEAIEEGNFKVLPGSFYVRAFIKSYAEEVGLDPNEVLKLYTTDIPYVETEPVAVPVKRTRRSTRNTDRISRWVSSLVMASFVLLILGTLYYYFYNNAKPSDKAQKDQPSPNTRITDKVGSTLSDNTGTTSSSSVTGKQAEAVTPQAVNPPQQPAPAQEPPKIEVKFDHRDDDKNIDYYMITGAQNLDIAMKIVGTDCWYQLDSLTDGKRKMIKQEQPSNGYTNTWSLDSSAYLRVGKANAVEITVNGTVIPAGDGPNPKNIQLVLQKS